MKFSRFTLPARIASYVGLYGLALIVIFPILWLTVSVFKTSGAIVGDPFALPESLDFSNITKAWEIGDFATRYLNSAIITVLSVAGILVIEGMAAYAFARMRFRGMVVLFGIFIAGQLIPSQAIVLPSALQISAIGLSDTLVALIFQYLSWAPFAILFLRAAFLAVPRDLEEAARIDGAGLPTILWRIILPTTRSAFATVATIYSLWIWNDFLFPLVYLQSADNYTVPLGLSMFQGLYTTFWGYLLGAIFVSVWPPLLVYIVLNRQIQERLAFSGSKG